MTTPSDASSPAPAAPLPIGIDLGTTNSLIACWRNGRAELIPNAHGQWLTPSAVSLDEKGSVLIGQAAWERRLTHPQDTAVAFKRDMGTRKNFRLGTRAFQAEELSALVLTSLKHDAEAHLGQIVRDVVISVPAYFNDMQRKATKAAAEIAGLNVTRLINEPTAAALAFGLKSAPEDSAYLVFDLGGGTFDVSIVDQFEGVIEIKASTGDNFLGGEDFTSVMTELLLGQLDAPELKAGAENTREKLIRLARLRGVADRLKCNLTQSRVVSAEFPLGDTTHSLSVSEETYENACQALVERLRNPIERAIRDARLKPADLADVVLVGGATRMPIVRKLATRLFGRFPNTSVDPDQAIAIGAASQAALVARDEALDEVLLTDVCPYSLGLAVSEEGGNHQVIHGVFSPIIERNVIVPTSRVRQYSTAADAQTEVVLEIYQGERRFCRDNIALGELQVSVPAKKRGEISIDVRFTYDVSGLLDIDVTVPATGQTYSKSLMGSGAALAPEEIEERRRALSDLKIHPREDLPNRAVLARADRLYAELIGSQREAVGQALTRFSLLLDTQDPVEIQRGRVQLEKWLQEIESSM